MGWLEVIFTTNVSDNYLRPIFCEHNDIIYQIKCELDINIIFQHWPTERFLDDNVFKVFVWAKLDINLNKKKYLCINYLKYWKRVE